MTLKPSDPQVPNRAKMTPRDWFPIVMILLIVVWLFLDRSW